MRLIAAALLLAACSGGVNDEPPPVDAGLPACGDVCPPDLFCRADGLCSCQGADGAMVTCVRD